MAADLVQGLLRVAAHFAGLAEAVDGVQPGLCISAGELIQRLRGYGLIEELNAHAADLAIDHDCLEVLLRQGQGRRNSHAGCGGGQDIVQHGVLEHKVTMHQKQIIIQLSAGKVDAVDIIGLTEAGVVDIGDADRQIKCRAVVPQHALHHACGDDRFFYANLRELPQLAGEDRLGRTDLGHAFRMLGGQHAHARAET